MQRLSVLLILLAAGCATTTARPILRDRDGGIVAIPDNSDQFPNYNRSQAEDMMREHVGKNFEIVREEEYVIGPVTTSETNTTKRPALGWLIPWRWNDEATTTSKSATRNQTEYRLYYRKIAPANLADSASKTDLPPLREATGVVDPDSWTTNVVSSTGI